MRRCASALLLVLGAVAGYLEGGVVWALCVSAVFVICGLALYDLLAWVEGKESRG